MTDTLLEKAKKVKNLRTIQRKLATTGHHDDALALRTKVQPHRRKVILSFLGVRKLPDTVNGTLVGEIAEVVAMMEAPAAVQSLCSLLRRAAWNDQVAITRTLFHAKALLPSLQKVEAALSTVKE